MYNACTCSIIRDLYTSFTHFINLGDNWEFLIQYIILNKLVPSHYKLTFLNQFKIHTSVSFLPLFLLLFFCRLTQCGTTSMVFRPRMLLNQIAEMNWDYFNKAFFCAAILLLVLISVSYCCFKQPFVLCPCIVLYCIMVEEKYLGCNKTVQLK